MAKEYQPTRNTREDEDDAKAKQQAQNNPPPQQQPTATDQVNAEAQKQAEAAAKERQAYLDELNRRIGEVVNFAGQNKDKNPQLLNLASEALKNAACQIDAATPQGVSRPTTQQSGNPSPSMR